MTISMHFDSTNSLKTVRRGSSTADAKPVPSREMWLWQNTTALGTVLRGLRQVGRGQLVDLGSFAQFADDDIDD
jgi:hypothetical protein